MVRAVRVEVMSRKALDDWSEADLDSAERQILALEARGRLDVYGYCLQAIATIRTEKAEKAKAKAARQAEAETATWHPCLVPGLWSEQCLRELDHDGLHTNGDIAWSNP